MTASPFARFAIRSLGLCVVAWGTAAPARAADLGLGQDAVILEESLELDIRSVTDARERFLQRTKVLTARGVEQFRVASVGYGPGTVIENLQGVVTLPSGKQIRTSKKDVIDAPAMDSFELYSDNRSRSILFPGIVPGSTVEYSYTKRVSNLFFLDSWFFLQEYVPARLKTLTVKEPAGVPLWLSVTGGAPHYTREENNGVTTHRWRVEDAAAYRGEPDGPPVLDLLPAIWIKPRVIDWAGHRIDASTWDGVAAFYREIAEDRALPTPEVARTAAEVTQGAADAAGKIRKIYEFLQTRVDYVAISLDIGGWQPHPSGQVLRYRYGDCKDKATLMIAMLRAVDLTGLPVLIRTRDSGIVREDQPSLSFNHAIVAIPAEGGYQFIDPTSTTTSFGDLPWRDQGATALVVERDGRGRFLTTPLSDAGTNRRDFIIEAQLDSSGNLRARLTLEARGQRLAELVHLRTSSQKDRQEEVADLMADLVPGAQLTGHEIGSTIALDFTVPRYATKAGSLEVASPHVLKFPGLTSMAASAGRAQPVFLPYPFTESVDSRLALPPGRTVKKLPQDRKLEGPGLAAETRYELSREVSGNVLHVKRSIAIQRREIAVAEYAAFRAFISALADDEARAVTLQPE